MTDRYAAARQHPDRQLVTKQIGLPQPSRLERYRARRPAGDRRPRAARHGGAGRSAGAGSSRLAAPVAKILKAIDADVFTAMDEDLRTRGGRGQARRRALQPGGRAGRPALQGAGVRRHRRSSQATSSSEAWAFFAPAIRRVLPSGRVIILGTPPEDCATPAAAIAQRALEGLERAIGKEVKRGATAQLVYVKPKAEGQLESTLRFLLSPKSAFVSGQVVRIGSGRGGAGKVDWDAPLAGKVALVTGAARGIGAAIAEVLARDGAHVVGLDVPPMAEELAAVTGRTGRLVADRRHHRRRRPRGDRRPPARPSTRASTWWSTTPASPATRRSAG